MDAPAAQVVAPSFSPPGPSPPRPPTPHHQNPPPNLAPPRPAPPHAPAPPRSYKTRPFLESFKAIQLYTQSIARYGKSPYIYPRYGLGELPQGFARLSAIYGGTYMLDKKVDEIVMENGAVAGVRCGDEVVKCKNVICDPSYVTNKKKTGVVIRTICLLRHAVPNTNNADSLQLILPMNQVGRKHDIYVAVVSSTHNVCPNDMWVAIVSTIAETNGDPEKEIQAGLALLGPIEEK